MNFRRALIWLSVFVASALAVTSMVYVTLNRGISGDTNTYTARFTDVTGMNPGDDVRVAGVRVGRVDQIELDGNQAKVTFRVHKEQTLYTDTIASVIYQNIIGQRYLGLSAGAGAGAGGDRQPLGDHGTIPIEHTEPSFDITYLLRGFEPLFTLLDPERIDDLTGAIIEALQGNSGSVLSIVSQTASLAQTFAGPDQVLGNLIGNLNTVVTNLASQNTQVQNVIANTRAALVALADRREELRASVGSIQATMTRLAVITEAIYPDLHDFVTREPGFATHLTGDARNRIAFLGANFPAGLKALARLSQEGAYGNIYACDVTSSLFQSWVTLFPAIVSAATPGNAIKHTPECR